jgi:hypothetical protein
MNKTFMGIVTETEKTYDQIRELFPLAAGYILTNAHRRRVYMKINAREMYHIARLRGDAHAQWDIRETAAEMLKLGRVAMPLALILATGKDGFSSLHNQVFAGRTTFGQ